MADPSPPIDYDALAERTLAARTQAPAPPPTDQPTPLAANQNDYDALAQRTLANRTTQAQAINASLPSTGSPDKVAQAAAIGQPLGLPAVAVMPNVDDYAQRVQTQKNNAILAANPSLAKWVGNDPQSAAIGQDDFQHLDTISKSAVQLGTASSPLDHYIQEAGRDILQAGTWMNPYTVGAHLFDIPLQAGALLTQLGLEHLPADSAFHVAPGSPYNEPPTFGALFEKIGEKLFPGGTPESHAAELADVASQFALPGAMLRAPSLAVRGFNALIGAGVGAGGQVSQEKAAEWAQQKFPDSPVMQNLVAQTAGLLSMVGIGAAGHTAGTILHDRFLSTQAQQDAQHINGIMDTDSETRKRSPHAFQSFMDSQTQGTQAENLFVPASKVMELYQAQNRVPSANDGLLGNAVPDIAEQLAQAGPRGGDVVIPTANYAAHLAGTPIDAALRPDLRARQDGMSLNEAKEYQANFQNIADGLSQQFDEAHQAQEPARLIYGDMQQKAEAAGFTTNQASQYAALTASRYMTRAARLGIDPLELYREQGIDLRRGAAGEAPEAAISSLDITPRAKAAEPAIAAPEQVREATQAPTSYPVEGEREPIPAAKALLPDQREVEARFADYLGKNFDEAKARYDAMPDSQQGRVLNTDTIRELSPDYLRDRTQSNGVHEPASWFTKQLYADKLKEKPAEGEPSNVLFTAGGTGAGKSTGIKMFGDAAKAADIIYDTNMNNFESSRQKIQQALDAGRRVDILYVYRDPMDALVNGALPRAMRQEGEFGSGRTVPVDAHINTHVGSRETILKLAQTFKDDPRVSFMAVDNSFGRGGARATPLENIPEIDHNGLKEKLNEAIDKEHQAGRISEAVYNGFRERGASGTGEGSAASLRGSPEPGRAPERSDQLGSRELFQNGNLKTDTPEFKKWFGDSKVVDADGNPRVMYHGTNADFDVFAGKHTPGIAGFFSGDPNISGNFSTFRKGGNILPVYIKAGNPWDYESLNDVEVLHEKLPALTSKQIGSGYYDFLESPEAIKAIKEMGYDGIYLNEGRAGLGDDVKPVKNLAIFNPEQVKSAIGNRGTFDGSDANILHQAERGKITMAEGKKIITLFEKADKSTFLHEMGHLWLEELRSDALRPDAPQQLKADWETVQKAIGHEGDGAISTESHEKFAESFEQYLMDGKAPSNALLGAFRRFKLWLNNIYRSVGGLGIKLSDDTRQVFDRMLASDDEISQMEQRQQVNRLFKTKDEAGMSDKEFAAYNATAVNAEQSAREQLLSEAMGDLKKRGTREWKAAEDEMRPDIEKRIEGQQDMRALDYFRTGKLRDENGKETAVPAMKIDRDALKAIAGDDAEKQLPSGMRKAVTAKGGVDPDDVAPFLGYPSGKAMIDDMLSLGKLEKQIRDDGSNASVGDYLADQEVQQRLHDKFGLSESDMRQHAEDMASSADRMDLKLAELRALGRKSGQRVSFTRESIKAWAQDQIAGMKAKDAANVYSFARAMAKAGRDAERALAKGDDKGAFQALQRQALNMAMLREAREAEHLYNATQKEFKRLASKPVIKSVDQDYLDQLHGVLRQFGYNVNRDPVELRNALQGKNLSDFLTAKNDEGRMLTAPDFLLDGQPKTLAAITTDQLGELSDFVHSMLTNARDEKTILRGEQKASFDQLKADLIAQRRPGETINRPTRAQSDVLRRGGAIAKIFAEPNKDRLIDPNFIPLLSPMRRVMDYMQALDNDKVGGVGMETLWQPLSNAADKEAVMRAAEKQAFDDFRKTLPKGWAKFLKQEFVADGLIDTYTGQPSKFTGAQAMGIALNIGNASNLKKMLRGEKWAEADIRKFLDDTLDKHHWDTVQFLIDRMESHWPETEELYKKLNGVAPTKIEPTPIETRFGTYPGGYFPIIFDPIRATDEMIRSSKLSIDGNVPIGKNLSFMDGMTSKGRTITRTDVAAPLLYDLNSIMPKMNEAIHDLAFREAIINANKFLSSRTVSVEISERLGQAAYTQLTEGVRAFARPYRDDRTLAGLNKYMQIANQRAVQVGVMFRPSTIVKHFSTMLFRSFTEIDPQWMLHGFRTFYGDIPGETAKAYAEAPMLKFRMDQVVTDMRQGMASLQGESTLNSTIHQVGHYGIGLSDQATALPIYISGRDKALSEGKTQDVAVMAGKQAVLDSHGGSRDVDLPALLRTDNQYLRAVTLFYSIMNHAYNRGILRTAREVRYGTENVGQGNYGQAAGNFAGAFARTLGYFILPGMAIGYFLGNKKDDESWAGFEGKAVANEFAGTLPGVRTVADTYLIGSGKGLPQGPVGRMADTVLNKSPHEAASALGLSNAVIPNTWLRDTLDTTAYLTGAPVGGQPAQTAQFLWDYGHGYQNPDTVQDWVHGLMHGKTK